MHQYCQSTMPNHYKLHVLIKRIYALKSLPANLAPTGKRCFVIHADTSAAVCYSREVQNMWYIHWAMYKTE